MASCSRRYDDGSPDYELMLEDHVRHDALLGTRWTIPRRILCLHVIKARDANAGGTADALDCTARATARHGRSDSSACWTTLCNGSITPREHMEATATCVRRGVTRSHAH